MSRRFPGEAVGICLYGVMERVKVSLFKEAINLWVLREV